MFGFGRILIWVLNGSLKYLEDFSWLVCQYRWCYNLSPLVFLRYLFTLDLPEYWENKHADQTLEVLMSDLDPAIMDQFYMKDGVSASDVTRVSRHRRRFDLLQR